MRTISRSTSTKGQTRRAPVVTTLAAACLAVPMSGLLGGMAFANGDGTGSDTAALKVAASDAGRSESAPAAQLKVDADNGNDSSKANAAAPEAAKAEAAKEKAEPASAANKPAGFVGPVVPAKAADKAPAAAEKKAAPTAQPTPFVNQGGVTTGSNTTKYETVADKKGSTFTGVGGGQPSGNIKSPQPYSNADKNNNGANDTSAGNPYRSTRDGSPSLNGNGGGQQVGQPCAGCVGKADNKNPPGQAPNATDRNAGYECDRNHGIGRSNPAHTGCKATTPTPPPPPQYCPDGKTPMPPGGVKDCKKDDVKYCPGTTLPVPPGGMKDCKKDDEEKKITICHSTSSETNPDVVITINKNGLNGHEDHANDVIPPYTFKGVSYPGKNVGKPCGSPPPPPQYCPGTSIPMPAGGVKDCPKNTNDEKVTICHATGSLNNPFVVITVSVNSVVNGSGHNDHSEDVIPSFKYDNGTKTYPGKNVGKPCGALPPPPPSCPAGTTMVNGVCQPPVVTVCPAGTTMQPDGTCLAPTTGGTGGEGNKPPTVVPHANPPTIVPIGGTPEAPAEGPGGALPFTGADALLLLQLGGLLLLVGGGLVGMTRNKKAIAAL